MKEGSSPNTSIVSELPNRLSPTISIQIGVFMSAIFKFGDWTVQSLVDSIKSGTVQLPDLQRPFVWPKAKVRDLLDSMYRGYPVGELMFWSVSDNESRAIGDVSHNKASHQIIDGQQRLTSLFAVFNGAPVRDADYNRKSIVISFNPDTHRFEVWTPALAKSAQWIENISIFFADPIGARWVFKERYEAANGSLDVAKQKELERTLSRLDGLKGYLFKVVEIQESADKKTVADIFVRINSEGVSLKASDFILTWLSVFWPEGREKIENFSRDSRVTAERASEIANKRITWTPKNHYLSVDPGQLVRVLVAVGQNRAKLADAYNALQAKDRSTGFVDASRQEIELGKLQKALPVVLNPLHWDEFIRCLPTAGFRSRKMITSDINLISSYTLWLLGRTRYDVDLSVLRTLIARWFFMAQLTGRYTGTSETQLQKDLDRIEQIEISDPLGFCQLLDGIIATELSVDFWTFRLPDALISSAGALSPAYQSYLAALNILDADMFMLTNKVRDWMDPTQTAVKGMETHHLFPRNYLESKLGITDLKRINQVANFAPTDWHTNNVIRDSAPFDYWPTLRDKFASLAMGIGLQQQLKWHALPMNWEQLDYDNFLIERRQLMAQITREAFERLNSGVGLKVIEPVIPEIVDEAHSITDIGELIDGGILSVGDILISTDPEFKIEAEVTEDRLLRIGGQEFDSIEVATHELGANNLSGLEFWQIDLDGETFTIAEFIARTKERGDALRI